MTSDLYSRFAALDNPALPDRFQQYNLDKNPLGEGAISLCYRARRIDSGEWVRLKVLRRRLVELPELHELWQRQGQILAQFHGDQILPFRGSGQQNGIPFFEFGYVQATSLRALIESNAPFHPDLVALIALGVVHALTQVHGARPSPGLGNLIPLHKNLKPENVLITQDGRIVLCDIEFLPIAYLADRKGVELPYRPEAYESPEQLLKNYADRRSDIYSLGLMMVAMASGRHPFAGSNMYEARQNVRENRGVRLDALLPNYSDRRTRDLLKRLSVEINRCTSPDADRRPSNLMDLESELTRFLSDAVYEQRERALADFLRAGTFQVERREKKGFIDRLFGG